MNKEAREKVIADYLFNWTPSGHADESERNALRGIYDAGYAACQSDNFIDDYGPAALGELEPDVCEWCEKEHPRVRSSVSDAWVHAGTPVGRVICKATETPAEMALRSLASYVGNGGYNAPRVDAEEFERKIREGIDAITNVEKERASAVVVAADRVKVLTDMLRDSGIENIHTPVEPRYLGGKWLADAKGDEISMTYIASVLNGLAKAQQALAQAALEAGEKE